MPIESAIGSDIWIEDVFSAGPTRPLTGHSKATQYHQFWSRSQAGYIGTQGRNELIAALILEYLVALGALSKYKAQPFKVNDPRSGHTIIPDFFAIGTSGERYVVEVKSNRFLVQAVRSQLERNRKYFAEHQLHYLLWTDRTPINHALRRNFLDMWRYSNSVDRLEVIKLCEFLSQRHSATVSDICQAGWDYAAIFAATWSGKIHFPLHAVLTSSTVLKHGSSSSFLSSFLGTNTGFNHLWNSLEDAK